jgi:mono/diheme cytochrome c family protein
MNKLIRLCVALVVFVAACVAYLLLAFPKVPKAPDLKVAGTPEQIARGKYLATAVCACLDCHSQRDWKLYSAPMKPGTEGIGGEKFSLPVGDLYAPNLTQLKDWSDGELYRAITAGVSRDGHALFPLMPYQRYGRMAREDVESIIAFLRTLSPKENPVPKTTLKFPMNLIVRTIPAPAQPEQKPTEQLAYGKYLLNAAACTDCHTRQERGTPVPGMELAGGMEFPLPDGSKVLSSNITPDADTGIGRWSKERFVQRFRRHQSPPLRQGEKNTIMPWGNYSGMTEPDLEALYMYLRTVPAVKNAVAH